jgi:predicted site-specific integrase-resolvase
VTLDPVLADGEAIAAALGISPGTIRNWASAGKLQRRGRDGRRRTLYDLDEVEALATRARSERADGGVTGPCAAQ